MVPNADPDLDAGSVVRCRTGFAYFYGTRAKVDMQIRTFGPRSASHLFNCVPYCLKIPKVLKSPDSHENGANLFKFIKKPWLNIF